MDLHVTRLRDLRDGHENRAIAILASAVLDLMLIERLHEKRIDMADENLAELKADYEQYRTDTNAKIQALIDAANNTNGTVPADVQAAINELGSEIRSDDAALTGGTGVTPTDPQSPEQPSQTV
jgi:hypothetical protein